MELEKLISELKEIIDKANMALDAKDRKMAREHLREAKDILDAEFLKD
ncbi:hypothetical protein ES705_30019 [subsurface metagenome]